MDAQTLPLTEIHRLFDEYAQVVRREGATARRFPWPKERIVMQPAEVRNHILWMCEYGMTDKLEARSKQNWLCCVQGMMIAHGYISIEQAKIHDHVDGLEPM